jgi:hypothetical protein
LDDAGAVVSRQPAPDPSAGPGTGFPGESAPAKRGGAGSPVDIWPSKETVARIAAADTRVSEAQSKSFGEPISPRRLKKDGLPLEMNAREVEERLHAYWSPSWNLIKDDAISEFSARKAGTIIKDWFAAWRETLKKQDIPEDPATRLPEAGALLGDIRPGGSLEPLPSSNKVATVIEIWPREDGTWGVRIVGPSGHRLHDRELLADVGRMAAALPPWQNGHGWLMRYTLVAEFTIIPPVPAVGFSFDEALLTGSFLYPLKKILAKTVTFDGAAHAGRR